MIVCGYLWVCRCVCEGEEGTMKKTKPSWHWE